MGITIKYGALDGAPILLTGEGRHPSIASSRPPDLTSPGGMWENSRHFGLAADLMQAEQQRVLDQVARRIDSLAGAIDGIVLPDAQQLALAKTALSDQPAAITAAADQEAAAPASWGVSVTWPSEPGTILGKPQNPVELTTMRDGDYTFTLNVDGDEHDITVHVNRSDQVDTQDDILGRLARAIDAADSRINAEVEHGFADAYDPAPFSRPMNRFARLKITSAEEGQGPDFYLEDQTEGGLVETYGLNTGLPSRAARLSLAGTPGDQAGDAYSLDGGHLTGSALASTEGEARIHVNQGPATLQAQLRDVIGQYDSLVSYLDAHADVLRPSLKDRIVRPLEDRARQMPPLGLRATPQGRLVMAEDFDRQVVAEYANVQTDLLGSKGWTTALRRKLGQLQSMDLGSFALTLKQDPVMSQRTRARALVDNLAASIISDYF